jgi:CheY-like chemotaxis protein
MLIGITAAGFVGNNSEPFSQSLSEFICFSGHWLELKPSLGRAEAKLPFRKAAAGSRRALKSRQVRAGLAFETAVPCFLTSRVIQISTSFPRLSNTCRRLEGKLETRGYLAQPSAMADGDSKRILVVDDDMSLARLISEALRTRFQCEVDATPNPEYAFELALKKRYRVFVFDFSMPMIDGAMLFALIGKVYNHVNPPLVVPPLILISGRGDEVRAQELMKEIGVRGFLPKPFAMNRLMEKIREVAPEL